MILTPTSSKNFAAADVEPSFQDNALSDKTKRRSRPTKQRSPAFNGVKTGKNGKLKKLVRRSTFLH